MLLLYNWWLLLHVGSLSKEFQKRLILWFKMKGRNFFWRRQPLDRWQWLVLEMLLKRTRAETVEKFFPSFIEKYHQPDVVVQASSFTIETRQEIDENGRVVTIEIDIREFTPSQNTTDIEQYSTIKTFLSEEFEEEKDTPEPVIQLMSVFPIVVTGLVWVAEGLIVGVPLCFASLGVVMLIKRVIIPLWKRELGKPM